TQVPEEAIGRPLRLVLVQLGLPLLGCVFGHRRGRGRLLLDLVEKPHRRGLLSASPRTRPRRSIAGRSALYAAGTIFPLGRPHLLPDRRAPVPAPCPPTRYLPGTGPSNCPAPSPPTRCLSGTMPANSAAAGLRRGGLRPRRPVWVSGQWWWSTSTAARRSA